MADAALKRMTVEEFLDWSDGTDRRYELRNGVPVAMAPPRAGHQILAANLAGHLFIALQSRPGCTVRLEAGIRSRRRADSFHQADLAVTCASATLDQVEVVDPLLIAEVLSPSTGTWDRRTKLPDYRAVPSVREIVLIDPRSLYCEVHRRQEGDRWQVDLLRDPDSRLTLDTVGLDLPLSALYANVPVEPEEG